MNQELKTALPDSDTYKELAAGAKSREDIVELRKMAQADIAKTATVAASGKEFAVTSLGADRFAELNEASPAEITEAMAVDSGSWRNKAE